MDKDEFYRPEYNDLLTGKMSEVRDEITAYRKRMYKYVFLNWWAALCIWLSSTTVAIVLFTILLAVSTALMIKYVIKRVKSEKGLRVLTEMLNTSHKRGSALLLEFEQDAAFALNALNALSKMTKKGKDK